MTEVPPVELQEIRFRPGIGQQRRNVRFTDGSVPLEKQLRSDAGGSGQLVGAVAVQVHGLGLFRSVGTEPRKVMVPSSDTA